MERIGNVTLDDTFYSGKDEYSDGSIELELLEYVKEYEDELEILEKDNRWPILYHISPVRKNILDWYEFKKDASVLEVGSGCGAVTGAICEKAKSVTDIELSKLRSTINAYRNRRYENLTITIGNFNDIKLDETYDYITLIGVLEYAAYYTQTENSFVDFLKRLKKVLKPDGKLLVAIENKYGMKYWSGCTEDHTGRQFDGIMGYDYTDSAVRTFSKDELIQLIRDAGFSKYKFYYPFPDYKFATQIFSDEHLPEKNELICSRDVYDNDRLCLFDETAAFKSIIEAGKFDFFSNSYFIEIENE